MADNDGVGICVSVVVTVKDILGVDAGDCVKVVVSVCVLVNDIV